MEKHNGPHQTDVDERQLIEDYYQDMFRIEEQDRTGQARMTYRERIRTRMKG